MSIDYKVDFVSEKTLAEVADRLRRGAKRIGRYTIDIIDLIERVLPEFLSKKGGLKIEFFDQETIYDEPAYVEYRPSRRLYVDRQVWAAAKRGCAIAYFILAHEVAHLLFHDGRAVAFSSDSRLWLKFPLDENKSEWQAHTFAKHLTIPDEVLLRFSDPQLISLLCNVEFTIAIERAKLFLRTGPMLSKSYEGEACGECGNFTLVRNGTCLKCDTCGSTTGCS
jgi:Zn-dependent peptidase ImmA (M78 family)